MNGPQRFLKAVALVGAVVLAWSATAYADRIVVDGDTVKNPPDVQYQETANVSNRACSETRNAVPGLVTLEYQGGTHFTEGETVDVTVTPSAAATTAGITTTGGTAVMSPWSNNAHFEEVAISTTVPASVPNGTYVITVSAVGRTSGLALEAKTYNVNVNCPAAAAAVITFDGFFSPVDEVNKVKAGQAVPLKWLTYSDDEIVVNDTAGHKIESRQVPRTFCGDVLNGDPDNFEDVTLTGNKTQVQWDGLVPQYIGTWKTEKSWNGQCREVKVTYDDGDGGVGELDGFYFYFTK